MVNNSVRAARLSDAFFERLRKNSTLEFERFLERDSGQDFVRGFVRKQEDCAESCMLPLGETSDDVLWDRDSSLVLLSRILNPSLSALPGGVSLDIVLLEVKLVRIPRLGVMRLCEEVLFSIPRLGVLGVGSGFLGVGGSNNLRSLEGVLGRPRTSSNLSSAVQTKSSNSPGNGDSSLGTRGRSIIRFFRGVGETSVGDSGSWETKRIKAIKHFDVEGAGHAVGSTPCDVALRTNARDFGARVENAILTSRSTSLAPSPFRTV